MTGNATVTIPVAWCGARPGRRPGGYTGRQPMLTLGQAARTTGKSKTTLTRAIKAGRLSATRRDDGSYEIDGAELSRVYATVAAPVPGEISTGNAARDATPDRDTGATVDVELLTRQAALEAELAGLKAMVDELRQSRDQAQRQADSWQQQAERATIALAAPAAPARRWWKRLTG